MKIHNISTKHMDSHYYWTPVICGDTEPDEWQQALMNLVNQAENEGVFYTDDMCKWVKDHADFVPAEWWDYQFSGTPVHGGVMGMEVYYAREALGKKKEREANHKALESIFIGNNIGTMSVNSKRVNKCTVESIEGNRVIFTGIAGRYPVRFSVEARNVEVMIEKAIYRGWRKQNV